MVTVEKISEGMVTVEKYAKTVGNWVVKYQREKLVTVEKISEGMEAVEKKCRLKAVGSWVEKYQRATVDS